MTKWSDQESGEWGDAIRLQDRCSRLMSKLGQASRAEWKIHGADAHQWRLMPAMAPAELSAFEQSHGVCLPAEYRCFLTRVGRAGAGPGYGLFDLVQAMRYERPGFDAHALRLPFPHESPFDPSGYSHVLYQRYDQGELSEHELERLLALQVAGTLVLSHEGCGILHLLVVNGPQRGKVWLDLRIEDGGCLPLGLGFLDWYECWLDHALTGASGFWFSKLLVPAPG